jgi:hypothetical protein
MIKYEVMSDLQPKKLTGIAIKKTQGDMFATDFLPERPFPEWSGYYKTWNSIGFGQLAPEVGEGAPDELLSTDYTEESFTMKEYRIGGRITERAIKFLMAKDSSVHRSAGQALVRDEVEFLADTLRLREEKTIIDALVNVTGKATAVTNAANGRWDLTTGTPITDIRTGIKNIREEWHTSPDTLLITPQIELDLLTHTDITDIVKYNGSVGLGAKIIQSQGISQAIPFLLGLDVYVTDAVTTNMIPVQNVAATARTESRLIEDTYALLFKRGPSTGLTYVAEPLTTRRWFENEYRSLRVQLFKTLTTAVFRPKQIVIITGI